jgi:hypothetical protein
MKNTNTRFSLGTNLKDNNLFCKVLDKKKKDSAEAHGVTLKKVIWNGKKIDIIHETHLSLSRATYSWTHKILIDKKWWVVPEKRCILVCALNAFQHLSHQWQSPCIP